jgi:hypothetical protein
MILTITENMQGGNELKNVKKSMKIFLRILIVELDEL